jgi:hypothetical protein
MSNISGYIFSGKNSLNRSNLHQVKQPFPLFSHSNRLPAGQSMHKTKLVNKNETARNGLKKLDGRYKIKGKRENTKNIG